MADFEQLADEMLPPGLYQEVVAEFERIARSGPGSGEVLQTIGLRAWNRLTAEQQRRDLAHALASYVRDVGDELNAGRLYRAVQSGTTYLGDFDVTVLCEALRSVRDLIGNGIEVEVTVDAQALANVLDELELLQHRLAMHRGNEQPPSG